MGKKNQGIRAKWSEDMMEEALQLLRLGHSQESVSQRIGIPRRTLRNHLKTGSKKRVLGAKSILTKQQENDLVEKIIKFAQKGFPLTPRVLRRCVYKFCEMHNIPHKFNREKQLAGKEWYRSFMKRHPNISQRKAQQLNPARAQKLNHFIVDDYFKTLNDLLERTGLKYKPGNIYNMDEKGCRLMLHHQQRVLAEKGSKRVHLVGSEHGENVTIVACANALGHVIPPMILFKGQRLKPTFADGLPAGSVVHMTPKGSMTTEIFIKWLDHFSNFMSPPPTILIFDGASSHLDITIADKAESLQIELLCLPSNTTHELQPMDKSVFRSFESHWDQELLDYWEQHPDRKLNKERFSDVFTPVWGKSMTISNICSGFRSTGIYPFNKNAIPEHAFAPSLPTKRYQHENIENHDPNIHDDVRKDLNMEYQSNSEDEIPLARLIDKEAHSKNNNSFSEILLTPDMQPTKTTVRKKALNYRAQEIKRDVFKDDSSKKIPTSSKKNKKSVDLPTTSKTAATEVWMCSVCDNDYVADMRSCVSCGTWVHEECVGLSKDDTEDFTCPECMP